MHVQELILRLQRFWADRGCLVGQPYDLEKGAGTMNPLTFFGALGPKPWNVGYVEPSRRPGGRPLRREPLPPLQAPPVPGDPQALPRQGAGHLHRVPGGHGHRPLQARPALRGGQLGIPDPGRLGRGLAGGAGRHGDHPVHLLPAGGGRGLPARERRADLRHRAHLHVPHGHRQHLRPHLGRREDRPGRLPRHLRRRCASARNSSSAPTASSTPTSTCTGTLFNDFEKEGWRLVKDHGHFLSRLRPGPQDEPHLQRAGRPRRREHHRAPRHHQAGAGSGLRLRQGLPGA